MKDRNQPSSRQELQGVCPQSLPVQLVAIFCFIAIPFNCVGCGPAKKTPNNDPKSSSFSTEVDGVRVRLVATPQPARLSDEVTLTLTVEAPIGTVVELPPPREELGDFLVRDTNTPLLATKENTQIQKRVYFLEPTFPGNLQTEPLEIGITLAGSSAKSIETEPLQIEVNSIVDGAQPSLNDLAPLEAPVDIPKSNSGTILTLSLIVVAVIAGLIYLVRRRKLLKDETEEPTLSPREQATRDLAKLLASGLAETDVKQFFVELTGIVRRYIELTTDVRAPEQTTEEFLAAISRHHKFAAPEKERLQTFLESADLIKYAALEPRREDIDRAVEKAREFISVTGAQASPGRQ